jgi:tetratricopeptide (TPR) repeat protein
MKAFFAVLVAGCAVACSSAPPAADASTKTPRGAQPEVEVPRTVITPQGGSSVPELLRDAAALATAERWAEAAAAYDRIYQLDSSGPAGADALWGAADAHDRANNLDAALSRYERVNQREPDTTRGREALVRATRLLVFLGRFEAAGVNAERLLKVVDRLSDFERIVVLSARALALLDRGEDQQAIYFIEKARDVVESKQLDAAGRVPRDLAQLYYALGESRRIRAERIVFEPMPPNFGAVLEARCQLLLDAQSAYSDSMRAYDAHWSAMAGFRTAELYQRLHQDLLAVKPPANADTERKRQLFEGAVRTRYAILLSKAKGMAEHTLAMSARTGERSEWVDRTRAALENIDRGIKDEEAALAKLPYTKADFEAYFAQMDQAAAAATAPSPPGKAAPSKPAPGKRPPAQLGKP